MNTPEDFVLWLNGFLAANSHLKELNAEQTRRIKDKLSTVFTKVTPAITYEFNTKPFFTDSPLIQSDVGWPILISC